tara:strand:- start:103072 stop:103224 length:153 start_codon:yes stop_codon:yes gene_type:complete
MAMRFVQRISVDPGNQYRMNPLLIVVKELMRKPNGSLFLRVSTPVWKVAG